MLFLNRSKGITPESEEEQLQSDGKYSFILLAGRHTDINANTLMRNPEWNSGRRACTLAMLLVSHFCERYLQSHPDIKRIIFAVDNDYLSRNKDGVFTNWGQQAAAKRCGKYGKKGYECAVHRTHLKDFNKD